MNPILDIMTNELMKSYEDFFSGVDIDLDKQIIFWKPRELKFNIFEILGTVMNMLRIIYTCPPYKLEEETFASVFIFKDLENYDDEILDIIADERYHDIIMEIHEWISTKIKNQRYRKRIDFDDLHIYLKGKHYVIVYKEFVVLSYVNNKLILYKPEKLQEVLTVISKEFMS